MTGTCVSSKTKCPAVQNFQRISMERLILENVLEVCNICLELPSDSGKYFGFVVEEFSRLSCAYYKMLCLLAGQSFHATIVTCHGCCVAGL